MDEAPTDSAGEDASTDSAGEPSCSLDEACDDEDPCTSTTSAKRIAQGDRLRQCLKAVDDLNPCTEDICLDGEGFTARNGGDR